MTSGTDIKKAKPTFRIPGYLPPKATKKPSKKAHLPPPPGHLQKRANRPKNIQDNGYYSISSKAKGAFKKLEKKWREEKQLSPQESAQLYNALDDLVICARTGQDYYAGKRNSESCLDLLKKLLEPFIGSEVNYFLLSQGLISAKDRKAKQKRKDIRKEWLRYARSLGILRILGDQLIRPDRIAEIKPYLIKSKPSEDRRLSLCSRNLNKNFAKLWGTFDTIDSNIKKSILSKLTIREQGDDVFRFFKGSFIFGAKGYDPYYLTLEEQNLVENYKDAQLCYEMFNNGELEGIRTQAELDAHLEEKELRDINGNKLSVKELIARIQTITKRKTNLISDLFTKGNTIELKKEATPGWLYNQLREFKRFRDKPPRKVVRRFTDENEAKAMLEKVIRRDLEASIEPPVTDNLWKVRYTYYPKVSEKPYALVDTIGESKAKAPVPLNPLSTGKSPFELFADKEVYIENMKEMKRMIIHKLPSEIHKRVFRYRYIKGIKQRDIARIIDRCESRVSQVIKDLREIIHSDPEKMKILSEYYNLVRD